MLGLGLSLQKGVSAFNAGRALVSSYIRRVTSDGGVLQNTACDVAAINELNQDRLLEPASWVLVPDGIKEDVVYAQKPSTGLGDLTFTRASDATYTDASGVVRRSPYNLLTFSEQFDNAAWFKGLGGTGIAPVTTANTSTSPIGTLTADRVQFNCVGTTIFDRSYLYQPFTAIVGRSYTFSIYIKANAPSEVGKQLRFLIENGTTPQQVITITADWTRYTFTATSATNTSINALLETRGTVTANTTADVLVWGAQLVEGTSALDYFPTTDRLNVPRIDFSNGDGTLSSCGRLLLEPQRTNLVPNGLSYNSSTGVAYNTAVSGSPMAGVNCARITKNEAAGTIRYGNQFCSASVLAGSTGYVLSAFFKYDGVDFATSMEYNNAVQWGNVTWSQPINIASTGITLGVPTSCTSTVENWGSGWYRVNVRITTGTTPSGSPVSYLMRLPSTLSTGQGFLHALPQLELGTYPTTYIPTTTAAVTRLADTASKTGVSSLIGQTEGTLFAEVNMRNLVNGARILTINNGTTDNRAMLFYTSGSLTFGVNSGGVTVATIGFPTTTQGSYKLAASYKQNDFVLYVNGAQVGTDTSGATPSSLSRIDAGNELGFNILSDTIAQAALFPTRLTNDQLEVLTSEGYGNYALLAQSLNCVLQ